MIDPQVGLGDTYTCADCGGTFEAGRSWDETRIEAETLLSASELVGETFLVCEDCFQAMRAREQMNSRDYDDLVLACRALRRVIYSEWPEKYWPLDYLVDAVDHGATEADLTAIRRLPELLDGRTDVTND